MLNTQAKKKNMKNAENTVRAKFANQSVMDSVPVNILFFVLDHI